MKNYNLPLICLRCFKVDYFIKILKSVLGQGNDNNNLDKLKKLILFKIQQLKKKKKKTMYRIETIRIIEEIDNLEFCLNAIVQDVNK